ncbi:hypothetical protein I314_03124 [Cryptococcus bacillisporus CA1873]|uniref:Uncharacterized protein n=1 Tax=Cryptococcus bacillisporus CA1873 TaxID=1296111 RepID=A0ABR5BBM5_CRYGA|nr:hypothetical protein I314_03124 [Cryptococcus bacillisporus CA1873]|eukprot:KIR63718.1 hypothetical protein I314_03124 [Cryptococcus gattii CA1873]
MATFPDAPARKLSPITELITSNSLHSLVLSAIDADADQNGGKEKSIVFKGTEDIIAQSPRLEPLMPLDSSVQSSAISISSQSTEPRSRIPRFASPSSNQRALIPIRKLLGDFISPATASSTVFSSFKGPSPGGLLPPPRPVYASKPKLFKNISLPSSPSPCNAVNDDARRRYVEGYCPHNRQAKGNQEQETEDKEAAEKVTKEKEMRDRRIEKTLKDKKATIKFGDQQAQGQSDPTSEMNPTVNMAGIGASEKADINSRRSAAPSPGLLHPTIHDLPILIDDMKFDTKSVEKDPSAQSHPSRSSSTKSSGDTKNAVTLIRVSSILSSIFGNNNSGNSPNSRDSKKERLASRRLPKRVQRQGNSSAKPSQGSTPCQSPGLRSPFTLLGGLTAEESTDEITEPVQVFRTSGIFGIRDDGSELYGAQEHEQAHPFGSTDYKRIPERAGSPHTQSDGVRRILYVENHVEEQDNKYENSGQEKAEEVSHSSGGPESPVQRQVVEDDATVNQSQQTLKIDNMLGSGHDASCSPSVARQASSSGSSSSENDYDGSFSLQYVLVTNGPDEHCSAKNITPDTVEERIQTSLQPSPSLSPHTSSDTAAFQSPGSVQPHPIDISPLRSSISAQDNIALVIANHLLATQAEALLRYSSTIKDTGEAMHKLAQESLEWGGVLMRIAGRVEKSGTTSREEDNNFKDLPHNETASMLDGPRRSASVYTHRNLSNKEVRDDHMRADGFSTRLNGNDPSQDRKHKGMSLPTSMLSQLNELGALGLMSVHEAEETWRKATDRLAEVMNKDKDAEERQEASVADRQAAATNGWSASTTTDSVGERPERSSAIASSYPDIPYDITHQQNPFYGHDVDPDATLGQQRANTFTEYPSIHGYASPENWSAAPAAPTVPQVINPRYTNEQLQLRSPSNPAPISHELPNDMECTEAINKQSRSNITAATDTAVSRGSMMGKSVDSSKIKGRKLRKVREQSGFTEESTLGKKHWWSKRSSIIA